MTDGALRNCQANYYAFSNVFEVAEKAKPPYERVTVGKNLEYVVEALRAEGDSPWHACAHDEFALVMDGKVEVRLRPLPTDGAIAPTGAHRARQVTRVIARRGDMALLPHGSAYQFHAERPSIVTIHRVHRSGQRMSAPPENLNSRAHARYRAL
jgi:hypothetical protein